MRSQRRSNQAGFTLLELLVAMGVMLLVLAGTTQILSNAMSTQIAAKRMLDMNSQLRAAMDLVQRDLLQVGQGLPVGRRVGIPNDIGATPIVRPGPGPSGSCPGVDTFPLDATIPAVTVGADEGPPINGVCTDVITILAADNQFGPIAVASIAPSGASAVIHTRDPLGNVVNISDDPDLAGDNLRPGDLLMLSKGTMSVLMQVTDVAGQTVTFAAGGGDPLGLNQFDVALDVQGTINQLKNLAPADPDVPTDVSIPADGVLDPGPSQATRIRMITYFVDIDTDPLVPRLVRVLGGGQPNAVGMGVEAFRLTYDISNQSDNPTSVRMDAADLGGTGACSPSPCSPNQVRKVNIVLAMNASREQAGSLADHGRQSQNTLYTQVSLRSMAFVDRYR